MISYLPLTGAGPFINLIARFGCADDSKIIDWATVLHDVDHRLVDAFRVDLEDASRRVHELVHDLLFNVYFSSGWGLVSGKSGDHSLDFLLS